MKKLLAVCALPLLAASFQASADTASWTQWTGTTGSFIQNSNTIAVTYTGDTFGTDHNAYIYNIPTSFTNAQVTNTPGTNGTILMTGGPSTGVNTFHFSQAVINPLMDLFSVGQNGLPVSFNFLNSPDFSILAQGPGFWGGGTLSQTSYSVTGVEGNGLIQFYGSFTDISFTLPTYEYYYGATVGGLTTVAAVPEPESYAMLLAGLGLMGFVARRKRARRAA